MKILNYIFVCLFLIGCNLKSPINIFEDEKKSGNIPLSSCIMMHDDSLKLITIIDEQESIINETNNIGNSLLHLAAYYNAIKCTKVLIQAGADVNTRNYMGDTPLMRACGENNFDIIKLLVEAGADVNACNRTGNTPLIFAIIGYYNGKKDSLYLPLEKTVLYLIKKGANVNFKGGELENTALGMAMFLNAKPIEKMLIENGATEN